MCLLVSWIVALAEFFFQLAQPALESLTVGSAMPSHALAGTEDLDQVKQPIASDEPDLDWVKWRVASETEVEPCEARLSWMPLGSHCDERSVGVHFVLVVILPLTLCLEALTASCLVHVLVAWLEILP